MANPKRERQRAGREARLAEIAAAQKRASRKRFAITFGVIVVVIFGILALVTRGGDDEADDVAVGDTTTSVAVTTAPGATTAPATPADSAAGEPCVSATDPLPEGAPEVPVEVGPPPTELVVRDLLEGDGEEVPEGATVSAHYIGVACTTGVIFDSSYGRGAPSEFSLDGVIAGWTQGVPGMKVGGQRLLGIPAELAYGSSPFSDDIRPDEPLWFVVEVVDVV